MISATDHHIGYTENDFTEKSLTSPRLKRALPVIYSIGFLSRIFKNNNPFMESVLVKLDPSSDHSFRLQESALPVLSPVVGQIPGAGPPLKAALDSLLENLKAADVSSL